MASASAAAVGDDVGSDSAVGDNVDSAFGDGVEVVDSIVSDNMGDHSKVSRRMVFR